MKRADLISLGWAGAVGIVLGLCLSSCDERVAPSKNSVAVGTRIVVPSFEWRVLAQDDLDRQCGAKVEGCVGWNKDTGRQVVYTRPPKFVDGTETRTLGHEMMHIALGDYHKEHQQ